MLSWIKTHKTLTFISIFLLVFLPIFTLVTSEYLLRYLRKEIDNTIKIEATNISACKYLPVGNKACGGPAGYTVYSAETTDIERYSRLSAKANTLSLIISSMISIVSGPTISTCSIAAPPKIKLIDGKCVTARD